MFVCFHLFFYVYVFLLLFSVLILLVIRFKQYFILNHFVHYILHDIVNQDWKNSHMALLLVFVCVLVPLIGYVI